MDYGLETYFFLSQIPGKDGQGGIDHFKVQILTVLEVNFKFNIKLIISGTF